MLHGYPRTLAPYDLFAELIVTFALQMCRRGISESSRLGFDPRPPILPKFAALACSLIECLWTAGVAWAREARHLRLTLAPAMHPERFDARVRAMAGGARLREIPGA